MNSRLSENTPEWVPWYTSKGYKTQLCMRCKGHRKHRSWCRWFTISDGAEVSK